ncbi:MAG: VOC family protein [Ktedonobacterales bacterium]|nr:VOC family protein [Ktedonobacterales bacterium]
MNLVFIYVPVMDLEASLAFYRETLGWEETWREGESTAAMRLPGSEVELMLDVDVSEARKAGPFLKVESVDAFYREHEGKLAFLFAPKDIPPGRYVAFADPEGNVIRLMDSSKESMEPA